MTLVFLFITEKMLLQLGQLQWLRKGSSDANIPTKDTCILPKPALSFSFVFG